MYKKSFTHYIFLITTILSLFYPLTGTAQAVKQALEFSKTIHNFGRFSVDSGIKVCTFEFKNTSNKPVAINNILSSCGCTTPEWPKKPIMPGEGGTVKVTFLNDQGPYPFDKSLTVYTSAATKPIILRITGVPYDTQKTVKDQFPVQLGSLGIRSNKLKIGQLAQGESSSAKRVPIVNFSKKPVTVKFTGVSPGLSLRAEPETVPANGMGEIIYSIDTKAARNWGNTVYRAYITCNGVKAGTPLLAESMIIDNFSHLNKADINNAPMVLAKNSSYNFGTVAKGSPVTAVFNLRNTGYQELKIYKIDENSGKLKITAPPTVKAGAEFTITVPVNTATYSGEQIFTLTLVTNSPNRPLVNLFITGTIK